MFKKFAPNLLAIAGFVVISFLYASPLLQGKRLGLHDIQMASAAAKELNDFHKQTGEWAWWTNSMFGGMPSFMIVGGYPNSWSSWLGAGLLDIFPVPANIFIALMIGFFVLMRVLRVNIWVSFFGSVAYAFGSYNLLFLEAGHISKNIALAFAPGVLAGFIAVFRGRYWLGIAITTLFMGLETYANHPQITYYLFFLLGFYTIFETYLHVKKGNFSGLLKAYAILLLCTAIGVGTRGMYLWNTLVYTKETTRGKSDLTLGNINRSVDGLDKDYAFGKNYAFGKIETLTLLAPNFLGGASDTDLGTNSETYKMLIRQGVDDTNARRFSAGLPMYFGPQGYTSGANYSGIIILFLFLLAMFIVKDGLKYVLLATSVIYLFIAWGAYFSGFNYFMFDYFPYFNKFRDSKMILTLLHLCLVAGAMLGLKRIIDGKLSFAELKKPLMYSLGGLLGFMIIGYFLIDFRSPSDEALVQNMAQANGQEFANSFLASIISDRQSVVMSDIFRSVFLLLGAAGLIWAFATQKIKANAFVIVIGLLAALDLILIDKRYLKNSDFRPKMDISQSYEASPADEEILKDKDPDFRVIDLATNQGFWSDARISYFHKSIGGYHGAKLKRMQELYENAMIKDGRLNMPILNMLNTKYFIAPGPNGEPVAQRNPEALGNAWFVNEIKVVKNADEEIKSVSNFNPHNVAFVDQKYNSYLNGKLLKQDTTATIKLTDYKPNALTYESNSASNQVAVFSEVYYRGNEDWKSYVDGQETPHFRANYVLRAMVVPAGKHKIEFKFQPKSVVVGNKIDLFSSIAFVLLIIGGLVMEFRTNKSESKPEEETSSNEGNAKSKYKK
ncbi:YfhO family protein [Emticicia sp. 17c]|uniref:YfhO family protein n=1 Tax=Emticicia sp. 17c TaxID=3127704 RepID=UPI00301DE29C